jgi:hypothetical protein
VKSVLPKRIPRHRLPDRADARQDVLQADSHDQVLRRRQERLGHGALKSAEELLLEVLQALRRAYLRPGNRDRGGMDADAAQRVLPLIGEDDAPELVLHNRVRGGDEESKSAPETQRVRAAVRRRADASEPLRRDAIVDDAGSHDGRDRRRIHVGDSDRLARESPGEGQEVAVVSILVNLQLLPPFCPSTA